MSMSVCYQIQDAGNHLHDALAHIELRDDETAFPSGLAVCKVRLHELHGTVCRNFYI